ncbi:MAG: carboxymuconolactone decarboxylase family protein [Actinomycetota bacterium]
MDDARYERGRKRMIAVHGEKSLATVEGLGDLGRLIVEVAYGDVYDRPGLSLRDRQLVSVGVLAALGRSSQLPQHLRTSLRHGVTRDELAEVLIQVGVLAGFPVAMNAMATLRTVAGSAGDDAAD